MYRAEADGSATVSGVAVAPFAPIQHMQLDVSTVNRLGNYCFRYARERGWLQTAEEMARATPYAESDSARPLVVEEGHAYTEAANTFFFAGVEEALANPRPHFHFPPTPSTLFGKAHFNLVHVGNSSYGVSCEVYTYLEGQEAATRRLLGTFKVTTVWVSKTSRTPAPLSESKRELFRSILRKREAVLGKEGRVFGEEVRVQRLPVRELLAGSGWFADAAAVAAMRMRSLSDLSHSEYVVRLPGCADAPLCLFARRTFPLRETDIDFNLHVNQLVTKLFVINAFRGAVADPMCAYARLLRPGEQPIRSDLLLRKFRIDYVREIPMRYAATEVYLFPVSVQRVKEQLLAACQGPKKTDDSLQALAQSTRVNDMAQAILKKDSRCNEDEVDMMEIGFFTVGVPAMDASDSAAESPSPSDGRFIATVGVMTAAACFLPLHASRKQ